MRGCAYLPDMAQAAGVLAKRRADLPRLADIPFADVTFSMTDLRAAFEQTSGRKIRLGKLSWAVMYLTAAFWKLARELLEMRYLHNLPQG